MNHFLQTPVGLTKTALRPYQLRAYEQSRSASTLIVLPTGSGKTLIASAVAHDFVLRREKVLLLVPTRLLVEQQATAVKGETAGVSVARYMSGEAVPVPGEFDVLVATPAAFISLQTIHHEFRVTAFGLVIFDEVHHVMKRHPYGDIARLLTRPVGNDSDSPQILGLSASLTYSIEQRAIEQAVHTLCALLNLSGQCLFTATKAELQRDGHRNEVHLKRTFEESSASASAGASASACSHLQLGIPGKAHESLADFLQLYRARRDSTGPLPGSVSVSLHAVSVALIDAVAAMEALVRQQDGSFVSPMGLDGRQKQGQKQGQRQGGSSIRAWGAYAHKQQSRTVESVGHCSLSVSYTVLEHLYEAARLVINSRQEALELAMQFLIMNEVISVNTDTDTVLASTGAGSGCQDQKRSGSGSGTKRGVAAVAGACPEIQRLQALWMDRHREDFCRLDQLKAALMEQLSHFQSNFRGIVFTQQRVTTHILQHFLEEHVFPAAMAEAEARGDLLQGLHCDVVYAPSAPATASLRVTPTQAQQRLRDFRSGALNLLVCTSVAEEGMDVPAANCVIRFDAVQTAVSLVQSRGRARQHESVFNVMRQSPKRTLDTLLQAEEAQTAMLTDIQRHGVDSKILQNEKKMQEASRAARLASAADFIHRFFAGSPVDASNSRGVLHTYAQKTKEHVAESFVSRNGQWRATLALSQTPSCCGQDHFVISKCAVHANKKTAFQLAAFLVLKELSHRFTSSKL